MRRALTTALTVACGLVVLGAVRFAATPPPAGPSGARGGEALEQALVTEQRETALATAVRREGFGRLRDDAFTPAPGWAGERTMDPRYNDWEPAIAADPRAPHVYLLSTRYGASSSCDEPCSSPFIALEISHDDGRTWSTPRPICACPGAGQYDPIVEVVPSTGDVYAIYMRGYHVMFTRSDDHGRTWSAPVRTYGDVAWNDKPVLATSRTGRHVYVSWNGPRRGDPYVTVSHDGGRTWTPRRIVSSERYYYAYDATVAPDGTVVFVESSLRYSGGAQVVGEVRFHAFVSRDLGATWDVVTIAGVPPGVACADCRRDYYLGHASVASDAQGRLVAAFDGAIVEDGPQRIYVSRSATGRRWSTPVAVSLDGAHATLPAIEARGDGDVRLVYAETADGITANRWNMWFRRSTDGGRTWSPAVDISERTGATAYQHPDGFEEVYGDYAEIAITDQGGTIAAWGEGSSYLGPGNVWFNHTP